MQDISSFEYSVRLEELGGFFGYQPWMHMHDVLRGQGITFQELGHRRRRGALASLKAQGFTGEGAASTELGHRGIKAALAILEAEGITRKEALREIGLRRCRGALASLKAQGFTGEGGAASASTELSRRGGEARSAIYRKYGNCIYPGCTYAILHGEFCVNIISPSTPRKVISVGFASGS